MFNSIKKAWYCYRNNMSIKEYDYVFDDEIDRTANDVPKFYSNYPYIYIFDNSRSLYERWGDWLEGLSQINLWCEENITYKWRYDIHRVFIIDDRHILTELGGTDILVFAFKDRVDYVNFLVKFGY